MRITFRAAAVAAMALLGSGVLATAKTATMTGTIGDAMCGVKHMMGDDAAGCTRDCVKEGSDYALIVDNKAYTLKTSSDSVKKTLNDLAGKEATVVGDVNGETITVTSVEPKH